VIYENVGVRVVIELIYGLKNLGVFPGGESKGFPPSFNSRSRGIWVHY
jgi:hypothetical protein